MSVFTTPLIEVPVECVCGRLHVGKSHFNEKDARNAAESKAAQCSKDVVHYGHYIDRGAVRANLAALYRENWL